MEEGRYLVTCYEKALFRGVERTVLFLQAVGDDGAPTQDFDEPVWGYFLQEETDRKNIEQLEGFLYCQREREENNSTKNERPAGRAVCSPRLQRARALGGGAKNSTTTSRFLNKGKHLHNCQPRQELAFISCYLQIQSTFICRKWICSSSENISLRFATEKCMWALNIVQIKFRITVFLKRRAV